MAARLRPSARLDQIQYLVALPQMVAVLVAEPAKQAVMAVRAAAEAEKSMAAPARRFRAAQETLHP